MSIRGNVEHGRILADLTGRCFKLRFQWLRNEGEEELLNSKLVLES